jgi:signal transduction histidine kinase
MTAAEPDLVVEALRAAPDERQRTRTAQTIAAGLAHELRNPVFAIASAARLLRYRVIDDPVIEKNVGRILREAERLNTLVTALLDYGTNTPVRLESHDPDEIWASVLRSERGVLESKALIVRHTPATPRASCALDADQWTQVATHLLSNAIDAAPEGSDLTLASTVLPNGDWRSTLTNAGPPMPPETLAHAFELLVSTKPGHPGIGLAIVSRIVADHGGAIALESDATGTTATLTLPAARAHG